MSSISSEQDVSTLKPRNVLGMQYLSVVVILTLSGIVLSISTSWLLWGIGQLLLAIAFLQWFIILHEAGHYTLFRTKYLNTCVGYIASILAGLPYTSWKLIHYRHHKWAGWQDKDATTAALTPRKLSQWQRIVINLCWKFWLPLFVVLYRITNYWQFSRVSNYVESQHQTKIVRDIFVLVLIYGLLIVSVGVVVLVKIFLAAFMISLMMQEILLLSQHTHIPSNLSENKQVSAILPIEQERYTRSLRFPNWVSRYILMHFDAHELHHMYMTVPGYELRNISQTTRNEVNWITWINESKRLSGTSFLFENKTITGFKY